MSKKKQTKNQQKAEQATAQPKAPSQKTAVTTPTTTLQHTYKDARSLSPDNARVLQRTIGNQALRRLIIQRKMTVGPVGDKYEQEADAVAKQVVSQLQSPKTETTAQRQEEELQMKPLPAISSLQRQEEEEELQMKPLVQRQEEEELQMKPLPAISSLQRQEEEELQMKPLVQRQEEEELQAKADPMLAGGNLSGDIESAVQSAKSGGQPLGENVRAPMEQAFGADFSGVKVHTGGQSDMLNRSLSARAFTSGHDVFFRQGEYNPSSTTGQELLAHELTHVVQQSGTAVQRLTKQETPNAKNFVQLKRAYRGLNSQFHGNNELRVLNKTNYHITVPDPERTLEFDEFHVTYENNTEGRQAHFFYSDKPNYQQNGENHAQNQNYRSDASQEESNLQSFSDLKNDSETKATSFISEVEEAEKELAARLKAEKVAKEKQAKADAAFQQGKNGLLVKSRFKDPAPGQSAWGPKVKFTQQEAQQIMNRILALLPEGSSITELKPIDGGEKFEIKYKLEDIRVSGAAAMDAVTADSAVAEVDYAKV